MAQLIKFSANCLATEPPPPTAAAFRSSVEPAGGNIEDGADVVAVDVVAVAVDAVDAVDAGDAGVGGVGGVGEGVDDGTVLGLISSMSGSVVDVVDDDDTTSGWMVNVPLPVLNTGIAPTGRFSTGGTISGNADGMLEGGGGGPSPNGAPVAIAWNGPPCWAGGMY